MDKSSNTAPKSGWIYGLLLITAVVSVVVLTSNSPSNFFHLPSLAVVLGGTASALLLTFSLEDLKATLIQLRVIATTNAPDLSARIKRVVSITKQARRQGRLVLEQEGRKENDLFFRQALSIAVDEMDSSNFESTLIVEQEALSERMERVAKVVLIAAQYAPSMGFIGTLLGLLDMLGNLGKPEEIGPSLALALITTLYGTLVAQLILMPIALRIKTRREDELKVMEATVVGLKSFIKDENPVVIEQRMYAYLKS